MKLSCPKCSAGNRMMVIIIVIIYLVLFDSFYNVFASDFYDVFDSKIFKNIKNDSKPLHVKIYVKTLDLLSDDSMEIVPDGTSNSRFLHPPTNLLGNLKPGLLTNFNFDYKTGFNKDGSRFQNSSVLISLYFMKLISNELLQNNHNEISISILDTQSNGLYFPVPNGDSAYTFAFFPVDLETISNSLSNTILVFITLNTDHRAIIDKNLFEIATSLPLIPLITVMAVNGGDYRETADFFYADFNKLPESIKPFVSDSPPLINSLNADDNTSGLNVAEFYRYINTLSPTKKIGTLTFRIDPSFYQSFSAEDFNAFNTPACFGDSVEEMGSMLINNFQDCNSNIKLDKPNPKESKVSGGKDQTENFSSTDSEVVIGQDALTVNEIKNASLNELGQMLASEYTSESGSAQTFPITPLDYSQVSVEDAEFYLKTFLQHLAASHYLTESLQFDNSAGLKWNLNLTYQDNQVVTSIEFDRELSSNPVRPKFLPPSQGSWDRYVHDVKDVFRKEDQLQADSYLNLVKSGLPLTLVHQTVEQHLRRVYDNSKSPVYLEQIRLTLQTFSKQLSTILRDSFLR